MSDLSIQSEDRHGVYKIFTGKHASTNGLFNILIIRGPIHTPSALFVFLKYRL